MIILEENKVKKAILLWLTLPLVLLSCGDSDLSEDYMVPEPRILAVRLEDPEVEPGGVVFMRMLMAGSKIDQTMTNKVEWFLEADPPVFLGSAPYNEDFVGEIPDDMLSDDEEQLDIPILGKIMVGDKSLFARKKLRITRQPVGKNPAITQIEVRYQSGDETISQYIAVGDVVSIDDKTGEVSFTANTAELPTGENDQLVYRWYSSVSRQGEGKIYAYEDEDITERLLGEGATANEESRSVVFSLKGEENDGGQESGVYDIYLVIWDNAADSQSSEEDRFGLDFIYFTLCVNTDCPK